MKIAILGIGAVGKCCLHLIYHFFDIDPHDVYLIERSNPRTHYTVNAFIQRGAIYLERNLNRENAAIQAFDLPKTSTTSGCCKTPHRFRVKSSLGRWITNQVERSSVIL